jgi:hypothetical protein
MFGREFNPDDIASQLAGLVMPTGAVNVAAYYKAVRPDEDERIRIIFGLLLLPLAISYPMVHTTTNPRFREALLQAHTQYLARIPEQDQVIDVGRYIVWNFEREAIARDLREQSCQIIGPSGFDGYQMRYGMLVRAAAGIRNRAFWTDFNFGMSQCGGDSKLGLTLAFRAMATSFTKRVLTIHPRERNLIPGEQERFEMSIALAGAFHAHGFFAAADLFKRLGA